MKTQPTLQTTLNAAIAGVLALGVLSDFPGFRGR